MMVAVGLSPGGSREAWLLLHAARCNARRRARSEMPGEVLRMICVRARSWVVLVMLPGDEGSEATRASGW